MKTLSIQQPWAWLIVNGIKDLENRDWATTIRGPFLVHAGKKIDTGAIDYLKASKIELPDTFETGGIVGSSTIVDCVKKSTSRWFIGEFGFVLRDSFALPFMPYIGKLGFFDVPYSATEYSYYKRVGGFHADLKI